ncbi:SMI1/KNR4 family protein [Paenibacillus jilunlii]|uniref:Knr4/Smi1-like domain-containing protein n=1 Tax=Paenibacillus jilunlii TaxID=682956 RepID=A0ABR5SXR2_9BACL|nr:SMI1/KNR4 family protein [Paenibacillus jilunlii]KWX77451.1 hypothetical protein AML91_07870 [Paenibacillus jilunlii]
MWNTIFEYEFARMPGADSDEIASFIETWNRSLTEQEMKEIRDRQRNPFHKNSPFYSQYKPLEPSGWSFPQLDFPQSYLDFLSFSNGGEFQNGERYFQFFSTRTLREMNLAYEFAEYMPGSVSFAMNGSGNHYIFDMRKPQEGGEYPILVAHSGNLDYEGCTLAADSFNRLCTERGEIQL